MYYLLKNKNLKSYITPLKCQTIAVAHPVDVKPLRNTQIVQAQHFQQTNVAEKEN